MGYLVDRRGSIGSYKPQIYSFKIFALLNNSQNSPLLRRRARVTVSNSVVPVSFLGLGHMMEQDFIRNFMLQNLPPQCNCCKRCALGMSERDVKPDGLLDAFR